MLRWLSLLVRKGSELLHFWYEIAVSFSSCDMFRVFEHRSEVILQTRSKRTGHIRKGMIVIYRTVPYGVYFNGLQRSCFRSLIRCY